MKWYKKIFKEHTGLRWMIEDRETRKVIGTCGFLNYEDVHNRAEIGYDLCSSFWGRGVMTEVAHAVLHFGFTHMQLNKIEAKVEPENEASIRLLHKLGFQKEGFMDYYQESQADIFCLQETKLQAGQIEMDLGEDVYQYWNYAIKKGYSGTAVFSRIKPISVRYGMEEDSEPEGRMITLEYDEFYLVNVYTPNAKRDLTRLPYRLEWEDRFRGYILQLEQIKPVIVCGDLNVAHQEIDLKNPKPNLGNSGFTLEERGKMTDLLASGYVDSFRHLYPDRTDVYSTAYEAYQSTQDMKSYPPPGKYYEVSGRNMHLYTAGRGEVTVVFASGWGTPNPYVDFSPLYDKLKSKVKIAVYDRFGYGYSDYTNEPRDVDTISEEIHQLLRTSGQRPPYIMVGHSLGSLETLRFAQRYPDEVAGMVMIDGGSPEYYSTVEMDTPEWYFASARFLVKTGVARTLLHSDRMMATLVIDPNGVTETEGTTEPAESDSDSGEEVTAGTNELPGNLPSDFPLPEDATIRLANSGENEGKQSAMVIFTTEQDMKTISKLYKDYFDAKKLTDAGQTIDDKNIIIQGTDPETQDAWSLIGGALASQEGVIELTLTWSES
ncbi:hypothetical protein HK101_009479 [Irineochytrium annulatum]|nr:hypothetical protein HK101_009479 [Irineochytrium annulatum]